MNQTSDTKTKNVFVILTQFPIERHLIQLHPSYISRDQENRGLVHFVHTYQNIELAITCDLEPSFHYKTYHNIADDMAVLTTPKLVSEKLYQTVYGQSYTTSNKYWCYIGIPTCIACTCSTEYRTYKCTEIRR